MRTWRVEKNRRLLVAYAGAVRDACARFRSERKAITQSAVLRTARVPQSLCYLTPRAGLLRLMKEARASA